MFAETNWDNLEVSIENSDRISSRFADVIITEVDFKNNDDEAIEISFDNVTLEDGKNQEYTNSIYYDLVKKGHNIDQVDCPWGNSLEIDPGESGKVKLCFNVPKENVSFMLHIFDNDPGLCKDSSASCQEKLVRVSVEGHEGISFSEPEIIAPLIESRGNIAIALGASISGCEKNNSCYVPYRFDAGRGSTISGHNVDSTAHTVTSGTPDHGKTDNFDSGPIQPGLFYSKKFDKVNVEYYFCTIHPWMTGLLNISRSGAVIEEGNDKIDLATTPKIPEWVKNTMQWYIDGKVSEGEMISAIQFLVNKGIIKLE